MLGNAGSGGEQMLVARQLLIAWHFVPGDCGWRMLATVR
jgi:hypothetical protein